VISQWQTRACQRDNQTCLAVRSVHCCCAGEYDQSAGGHVGVVNEKFTVQVR